MTKKGDYNEQNEKDYSGLDFVVIDTEHGPYDNMQVSDQPGDTRTV